MRDGEDFKGAGGAPGDDEDGWLRTGGLASSQPLKARDVRAVDDAGNVADTTDLEEDDIPDMEDEDDDDAIIRDTGTDLKSRYVQFVPWYTPFSSLFGKRRLFTFWLDPCQSLAYHLHSGRRTYTLYIMYSPYYRTPRLYLSGYQPNGQPLPPQSMMEDIVGDYKDKTVTLEDFPFFANNIKMASVHPCKHASVMKTLLDRADAALRIRRDKLRAGKAVGCGSGMNDLVDEFARLDMKSSQEAADKDEWEEVQGTEADDHEVAIRVDQYLVVFLKVSFPLSSFSASQGFQFLVQE